MVARHSAAPYDALLLVSFGGPEKPDDVVPFLLNVTRGKDIPVERLEEVGQHY
jgi:protoporphyrin/coproporphyrin ferrochelatase